ncbi:family 78 glycoside hydrolase catalytic domain, partial [Halalkalicoccus tibetensis]
MATDADVLPDDATVWDSGRVDASRSTAIEYGGEPLEPDTTYHWTVRIWDDDTASDWSDPTHFTTAITESQWAGEWIGVEVDEDDPINNTEQNTPIELEEGKTLGQTFTSEEGFDVVAASVPTWETDDSDVTFSLYEDGPDSALVTEDRFTAIGDGSWVELTTEERLPPGDYYLEQSNPDGTIGWWSHTDDVLEGGQAFEDGEPVNGDRTLRVTREDSTDPSPLLRTDAMLDGTIESARAHVVTLGYGELYTNGERIGDEQLNPAWTKYEDRVLYSSHDVTDTLKSGENALGLWLGRGWYSKGNHELPLRIPDWEAYGAPRGLLQLEVTYADGTTESVTTDGSWTMSPSPITENDIYDGETYDAREEQSGWAEPGFDDSNWNLVDEKEPPSGDYKLRPQRLQPIEATETFEPESIVEREDDYLVDFGQNLAGWVELTIREPGAGDEVVLRHAETVDDENELVTVDLRDAEATDRYVARGDGVETYEPRFTYHGYRYVTVEGYPGELTTADIVSKAVHTGFEEIGSFACSNEDLNQVQHNAVWGLRSNAHGLPTDCPQRDERFGWTGDVHQNARADFYN